MLQNISQKKESVQQTLLRSQSVKSKDFRKIQSSRKQEDNDNVGKVLSSAEGGQIEQQHSRSFTKERSLDRSLFVGAQTNKYFWGESDFGVPHFLKIDRQKWLAAKNYKEDKLNVLQEAISDHGIRPKFHLQQIKHGEIGNVGREQILDSDKDLKSHLSDLGREHAQRDAATMIWQSQMKQMQNIVPDFKLGDDVLFYGGCIFTLSQEQGTLIKYHANANISRDQMVHHDNVFQETLNIYRVPIKQALDVQLQQDQSKEIQSQFVAQVETIFVSFDDDKTFERFYMKTKNVMQQQCCTADQTPIFQVVMDGRILYYWKFERKLSKQDQSSKTQQSNVSVFKLFKLDLHLKNSDKQTDVKTSLKPQEIVDRRIEIQDYDDRIAVSIGFVRNQTNRIYTQEIPVFFPQQEDPFLDDQLISIKYVFNPSTQNTNKTKQDYQRMNTYLVQICQLGKGNDCFKEVAHYHFKLNQKVSVLRAQEGSILEQNNQKTPLSFKNGNQMQTNAKQHTTEARRKHAKVKIMMNALKVLFEKRLQHQLKKRVIIMVNDRFHDAFDLIRKKSESLTDVVNEKQIVTHTIPQTLQGCYSRIVVNNCFVTLYDYQRECFFFQRCEPVVATKSKTFMILDSIFGKMITMTNKQQNQRKYLMRINCLKNYGQAYDSFSPFDMMKHFDQYRHQINDEALSIFLAQEIAYMNQNDALKHQQLIISKRYTNIIRRDDSILLWQELSKDRPSEIADERNTIARLSLENVTFVNNPQSLQVIQEQREENELDPLSNLTILPEEKRIPVVEPIKNFAMRTKTIKGKQAANIVQIQSQNVGPIGFCQDLDGKLRIRTKADIFNVNRLRRQSSIQEPEVEIERSLGDLSLQISTFDKETLLLEPLDQNSSHLEPYKRIDNQKLEESWRIVYEKVRINEDDRIERPIVVYQLVKNERQKLLQIQYWLCVFNFQENQISQQKQLWFPEIDLQYEPHSVCISASSEPVRHQESRDSIDFTQKFQVSFSLAHQRRVKILEFQISWGEVKHEDNLMVTNYVKEIEIQHIGTKEFIMSKKVHGKIEDTFDPQLVPLFNKLNMIDGTQLIFGQEENMQVYLFPNKSYESDTCISNPILSKQGYLLYRCKASFELEAILAFAELDQQILKNEEVKLTYEDASSIVEQSVRVVLNSVVFDPMTPVYNSQSILYFLQNSIGRSFESLNWFSPLSIKGIQRELESLLVYEKPKEFTSSQRRLATPFSSLIDRVLLNDYSYFQGESLIIDDECDMDFNRLFTFTKDKLLFKPQEILQKDWQLNSSLHYLFDQDQEMDLILSKVFKERDSGTILPEAEYILKSLFLRIVRRPNPLALYQKYFISQPNNIEGKKKFDNDKPGETMNIIQKIRGKYMPKKQKEKLQVFPSDISENLTNLMPQELVRTKLSEEDLAHGLDYEVDTHFIDLRNAFLEQKLEWIKKKAEEQRIIKHLDNKMQPPDKKLLALQISKTIGKIEKPISGFTDYHLAQLIIDLQENPACDLDEEALLRHLIDFQWRNTRWWQYRFFLFYLIFYIVPFFYQIFQKDARTVIVCNCSCFVAILFLFTYEFMQYYVSTFADYSEDLWNKADIAHISMYACCYFGLRISRPEGAIPDFFQFEADTPPWSENYAREYAIKAILTFSNVILIVLAVLKLLNFMRIFEGFGLFILLIGQCLADIKLFFLFMILWLSVFTAMLYILNCDVPNYEDYPHLPWWLQLTLQVWRNSLGDIQPPEYSTWFDKYKELDELKATHAYVQAYKQPINVIIGMLWFIWFLNCVFNQVIMLNFMIAIISESYERVMKQRDQLMYSYKSDLNLEVEIFISYFEWLCVRQRPVFNSIILVSSCAPDAEEEWAGLSTQARNLIGHVLMNQRYFQDKSGVKLDKLAARQLEIQEQVESACEGNKETLKHEMQDVNIKISQMTKSLEQMGEAMNVISGGLKGN